MVANVRGKHWYGMSRAVVNGFASLALGSTAEYSFFAAPFPCKIIKCSVIFDSAVTGAATHNFGVRFKNKGPSGSGTAVIATKTFASGTNGTAYDETDLGAVSNAGLREGDVVTFEKFENGSGLLMPSCTAKIEYVRTG